MIEIVNYGDPILRAKGAQVGEIDGGIRGLAEEMLEAMRAANGIGLAAQQVGRALQMAVVDIGAVKDRQSKMFIGEDPCEIGLWQPMVMVNPRIDLGRGRESATEGCLSFPEISGEIPRAPRIRVRTMLLDGREIEFDAEGLLARVIQHEHDHLQGILFIDRMSSATRAGLSGRLKRLRKETEERVRRG